MQRSSFFKLILKKKMFFLVLMIIALGGFSQIPGSTKSITVTNDAIPSSKKGYYNWVIYVVAPPDTLKKISQVNYTLHSSFNEPVQTINYRQSNVFRYCASGWGEFLIKVKIIFHDKKRKPLELKYQLNFRNKRTKYLCK